MSQLVAPQPYYVTGLSSFNVIPGVFYRVDTSAGAVTASLPPVGMLQPGDWVIIKNISGAHAVTITAWALGNAQEYVEGGTTFSLSTSGQRCQLIPASAPGIYPTPGWTTL